MKRNSTLQLLLIASSMFTISSCQKFDDILDNGNNNENTVYYGPFVSMGNGNVRSYVTINNMGEPQDVGVTISREALSGLTQNPADYAHTTFNVFLPEKARNLTAFDHITINWNPKGHEPEPIYGIAHFDFHFYKITVQERMAIPAYSSATAALFDKWPPSGYVPGTYIPTAGGEAQMGKHWVDTTAAELHGTRFTKTFIYGTYNGRVNFYEPMITLALLQSGQKSSTYIPQPQYFAPAGKYYPTKYKIDWNQSSGKHYVSLSGFVRR